MAAKKPYTKLQCQTCKRVNYFTKKSKKAVEKKMEIQKFCRWCKKHTKHKEVKK